MKSIIKYLSFVICAFAFASCAIVRGYRAFEHCEHDTIANGDKVFHFPVAERPVWIDTLHFFNDPPRYNNATFVEAIARESKTQGVLIIHNDSIVFEQYWGDFSAERMATVFSVSKSYIVAMRHCR